MLPSRANLSRRMTKMEMALDKNALSKLDWWLKNHPNDTRKGDGSKYPEWTELNLLPTGIDPKQVSENGALGCLCQAQKSVVVSHPAIRVGLFCDNFK